MNSEDVDIQKSTCVKIINHRQSSIAFIIFFWYQAVKYCFQIVSFFTFFTHKTSDLVPRVVQERNSSLKLAPNVPLLYILTSGTYCHDISA